MSGGSDPSTARSTPRAGFLLQKGAGFLGEAASPQAGEEKARAPGRRCAWTWGRLREQGRRARRRGSGAAGPTELLGQSGLSE